MSDALNTTKMGSNGEAFLFDKLGNVVGMSNARRLNFTFNALTSARNLSDPLLSAIVEVVLARSLDGTFAEIPVIPSEILVLAGVPYLFSSWRLAASSDLNWTTVIVIPRDDYFAVSDVAVRQALIIGIFTVLFLIGMTVVTSILFITLPLRRLANGMDVLAENLEVPLLRQRRPSFIHEVAKIESSFGHMAAGINCFSKFVPGPVVRQLIKDARDPQVSVSRRECTFFFSDIVQFTSIAERVDEDCLSILLSEYFGAMESILRDLEGITTDYFGDELFVFWGAPSFQEKHAILACEAALRQQKMLKCMRETWVSRGLPEIYARMGINTGSCLVGNFGSSNHLKYTVMGDAVNVASRLEQLNKLFGTEIMIGEKTFRVVKDSFLCRVLHLVILKGKSEPTKVYELLCRAESATEKERLLADLSERLLNCFLDGNLEGAVQVADSILERFPRDVPTMLLKRRCEEAASKPKEDWKPALELFEK